MPPPPDYAIAHMVELMHHYAYVIVHGNCEDIDEMECWKALQYFQKDLPRHNRSEYGRFANSVKLAEIAIMLAVDPKAKDDGTKEGKTPNGVPRNDSDDDTDDEEEDNDNLLAAQTKTLTQWTRLDWELLDSRLQTAHKSLLREDADATVTVPEDEKPQRDQARAKLPCYTKKYNKCRTLIAIHRALAPIRVALEQDLMSKRQRLDLPSIQQFHLQELRRYVNNMEDGKTKTCLRLLFLAAQDSEDLPDDAELDTKALQEALSSKLRVTELNKKIIALLKSWSDDIQHKGRPRYTDFCLQEVTKEDDNHYAEEEEEGGRVTELGGSRASKQRNIGAPKTTENSDLDADGRFDSDGRLRSFKEQNLVSKKNTRKVRDMRHASSSLREAAMDPLAESYSVAKRAKRHTQSEVAAASTSGHGRNSRHDEQDDDDIIDYDDDDDEEDDNSSQHTNTAPGRKTDLTRRKLFARKPSSPKVARRTRNDDPLASSSENEDDAPPAKKHKSNSKGISNNAKKKSARQEVWTDSPHRHVRLSELPGGSRASETKPQSKKRRFFSANEKAALKKGVAKHGAGKWREILTEFSDVFEDRTTVNLKDLYRTLSNNGEI